MAENSIPYTTVCFSIIVEDIIIMKTGESTTDLRVRMARMILFIFEEHFFVIYEISQELTIALKRNCLADSAWEISAPEKTYY